MPEEVKEKKEKKSIKVTILIGAILVGLVGVFGARVSLRYIKAYKHKLFREQERERFESIVIECDKKIKDENTLGGKFILSEEEKRGLIEECVSKNNRNKLLNIKYITEF